MTTIEVEHLNIDLFDEAIARHRRIVSDVSFSLRAGQGLGVTGESGSGKTTLSLALGGMLPPESRLTASKLRFAQASRGAEQVEAPVLDTLRGLRGRATFTLFQEPRASLNPYRTIGHQLNRCARRAAAASSTPDTHAGHTREALAAVGLDWDVTRHYAHELSTGMCQRVFLAMADLLGARLLIADEPFASVDRSSRDRSVKLVRQWMRERGIMLVLVSHELELLRELTDHVLVMYRGAVAESGPTATVLGRGGATHPYSRLLTDLSDGAGSQRVFSAPAGGAEPGVACCFAPRCAWADAGTCTIELPPLQSAALERGDGRNVPHQLRCVRHPVPPRTVERDSAVEPDRPRARPELIRVRDIDKQFRTGWLGRQIRDVLDGVSFSVSEGERLGIQGPSGQGKTTLARIMLGVLQPNRGLVEIRHGTDWKPIGDVRGDRASRRQVQMLYQDADLALDPAARVGDSVVEAYRVFDDRIEAAEAYSLTRRLMHQLALPESLLEAHPYRLSGGERKRVALARTLAALGCPFAPHPDAGWRLLILDEPTAGIDLFLQEIIARFLIWAQERLRLSYLVISHHEPFVRRFCHRYLRLEHGQIDSGTRHEKIAAEG